jgi:hypothetical protein
MYVILNEPNKIIVTVTYTLMWVGLISFTLWNIFKLITLLFEKPNYRLDYINGKLLAIKKHRGKIHIKEVVSLDEIRGLRINSKIK